MNLIDYIRRFYHEKRWWYKHILHENRKYHSAKFNQNNGEKIKIEDVVDLYDLLVSYMRDKGTEIKKEIPFVIFIILDLNISDADDLFRYGMDYKRKKELLGMYEEQYFNKDYFDIYVLGYLDNSYQLINKISDYFVDFYLEYNILPVVKPYTLRDLEHDDDSTMKQVLNSFLRNKILIYDKSA